MALCKFKLRFPFLSTKITSNICLHLGSFDSFSYVHFKSNLFKTRRDFLQTSDFGNTLVMISLSENGLNPGIAHLYWKRSSGLLESWEGLLLATDVSSTCAEAIFRLDSIKTMLKLPLFDLRFILLFFFQAEDGIRDVERSRGLGDVYKRQA